MKFKNNTVFFEFDLLPCKLGIVGEIDEEKILLNKVKFNPFKDIKFIFYSPLLKLRIYFVLLFLNYHSLCILF